jgi:hypothetical protein
MSFQARGLHEALRPNAEWALAVANHYGLRPNVTSVYRSWTEQLELRRRWEQGLSPWPANLPGDSAHNHGLAWDSVLPEPYKSAPGWQEWWNYVRELAGFAVPANDEIHAELPAWRGYV